MIIEIPVSIAEFFDKIAILEIKLENITEKNKSKNIASELALLKEKLSDTRLNNFLSHPLYVKLKDTNRELWKIFDALRNLESKNEFNEEYASISEIRDVKNDERASIKQKINELFNSEIFEVKEYQ